jgi:hypothetical protein
MVGTVSYNNPSYRWGKTSPSAIPPERLDPDNELEVGWVVNLTERKDTFEDQLFTPTLFTTDLIITPPPGFYLEVTAMPDLYKHNYIIPGTRIIQPGSEEALTVPLIKIADSNDLELPFPAIRIIPKRAEYHHMIEGDFAPPPQYHNQYFNESPVIISRQPTIPPIQAQIKSQRQPRPSRGRGRGGGKFN